MEFAGTEEGVEGCALVFWELMLGFRLWLGVGVFKGEEGREGGGCTYNFFAINIRAITSILKDRLSSTRTRTQLCKCNRDDHAP